jgi:sulfur relay protein TusB/DsrH
MLYIVNKKGEVLKDCVERLTSHDVILLIEDAVFAAVKTSPSSVVSTLASDISVYALRADMKARGLDAQRCYERIQYVDYAGFVELVENNKPVRSCF